MVIICMLDAINKAASLSNIRKGFQITGLVPVDRNMPLSSSYAMPAVPKIYDMRKIESVNNKCLNNSQESLAYVYKLDYHENPCKSDFLFDFKEMSRNIKMSYETSNDGWALSNIPNILLPDNNNGIRVLSINQNGIISIPNK